MQLNIGALKASLTERATDVLWVYNNPALCRSLVVTCNWSTAEFERWLSRQIAANLAIG